MHAPKRANASPTNYAFSLGLDQKTLTILKEIQVNPRFILKGNRQPSRTLITRAAIQYYGLIIGNAEGRGQEEWLKAQHESIEYLSLQGRK